MRELCAMLARPHSSLRSSCSYSVFFARLSLSLSLSLFLYLPSEIEVVGRTEMSGQMSDIFVPAAAAGDIRKISPCFSVKWT